MENSKSLFITLDKDSRINTEELKTSCSPHPVIWLLCWFICPHTRSTITLGYCGITMTVKVRETKKIQDFCSLSSRPVTIYYLP